MRTIRAGPGQRGRQQETMSTEKPQQQTKPLISVVIQDLNEGESLHQPASERLRRDFGLVADVMARQYFETNPDATYSVGEVVRAEDDREAADSRRRIGHAHLQGVRS